MVAITHATLMPRPAANLPQSSVSRLQKFVGWPPRPLTKPANVMVVHKSFFNRVPARARASFSRSGVCLLVVPLTKASLPIEW